ncbi:hypothetical protein Trydic_g23048 [Trypoxylus dichotomus]
MRILVEAIRTLLKAKKLEKRFWAEAINTAAYVLNRTGTNNIEGKTPYESWFHKHFDINGLEILGSEIYVHIPKGKRRKWDSKARKGIVMGYGENTKVHRVYLKDNQKLELARDVVFAPHVPDTEGPGPYIELQQEDLLLEKEQPNKQTNEINVENGDDEPQSIADIEEDEDNNINVDEPGTYNLRNRVNLKRPIRMDTYEACSCYLAAKKMSS